MIPISELREGNLGLGSTFGEPKSIYTWTYQDEGCHAFSFIRYPTEEETQGVIFSCSIEEIEPIPLSSEILEKLGFVWNEQEQYWGLGDWSFYAETLHRLEGDFDVCYWNIDSVHLLQNAHFFLTGKELTYTP